jgi:hypothetical protein
VVVIAVFGGVVFTAHVDDGVTFGETSRISCPHERGRVVCGKKAEEINGESLVGMEVAATGKLVLATEIFEGRTALVAVRMVRSIHTCGFQSKGRTSSVSL